MTPASKVFSFFISFGIIISAACVSANGFGATVQHKLEYKPSLPPVKSAAKQIDAQLQQAIQTAPTSDKFPNSNYAQLLDIGEATVKADGTVIARYRETYKLFNQRARNKAEVDLPFNASFQTVKVINARTIKKNGSVQVLKDEDIMLSTPFHDYLMYDDAKSISFSMPGIEDDCIIDYTVEMVTKPLLMPGQFWTHWGFNGEAPVGLSRYTLHVPASISLRYQLSNAEAPLPVVSSTSNGLMKTYTWEMKNIEPIVPEPSMPNPRKTIIHLETTSINSWQDVTKWYWNLAQPQMKTSPAIEQTVNKLIAGMRTQSDKARAIYNWVADKTRYVGVEFGVSAFKPHQASEVFEKLYGDCKDKVSLLITMLKSAGITAHPALLQANDKTPRQPTLPTLNGGAFNHCITLAEIDGKEVWLDATSEITAYGDIPGSDRGSEALVVRDGAGKFETVPKYGNDENALKCAVKLKLKADGSAEAEQKFDFTGALGEQFRSVLRSVTPEKRVEIAQRMAQGFSVGSQLKSSVFPDEVLKAGTFHFELNVFSPGYAKKTSSLLLLPLSDNGAGVDKRNPFVADKRVWPIVEEESSLIASEEIIELPAGYQVEDIPADVHLSFALQEMNRTIIASSDGRSLKLKYLLRTHPGTVPPYEYEVVRKYYDALFKSSEDQLVLRKF